MIDLIFMFVFLGGFIYEIVSGDYKKNYCIWALFHLVFFIKNLVECLHNYQLIS